MRHFAQLAGADRRRLFAVAPQEFHRCADASTLAMALGATLYMPADRRRLADDLGRLAGRGVQSTVICLEDAIADGDVVAAQENVVAQLRTFARRCRRVPGDGPLVFVRVRRPEQITAIVRALGDRADALCGFVLPKFTELNGVAFLDALGDAAMLSGARLFGMPVIESAEVIHRESRGETLSAIQDILTKYRESVLAVRIGATDLCAAYGIRRGLGLTIYDVRVVADVIADVVNVFGRADDTGHVVTGPVWEYFSSQPGAPRPDAGVAWPTDTAGSTGTAGTDGLLREVVLDKANGLTGKTVIHPSHAPVVHALMVVTAEEYADATDIMRIDGYGGGVCASSFRNKMNEAKPHRTWAQRTLRRAAVFGVAADGVSAADLLRAGSPA